MTNFFSYTGANKNLVSGIIASLLSAFFYAIFIGKYTSLFGPFGFIFFGLVAVCFLRLKHILYIFLPLLFVGGAYASRSIVPWQLSLLISFILAVVYTLIFVCFKVIGTGKNIIISGVLFALSFVAFDFIVDRINPYGGWTTIGYSFFDVLSYLNLLYVFAPVGIYIYTFLYAIVCFFLHICLLSIYSKREKLVACTGLIVMIFLGVVLPISTNLTKQNATQNIRFGLVNSDVDVFETLDRKIERVSNLAKKSDVILTGEGFLTARSAQEQLAILSSLSQIADTNNVYIFAGIITIGEQKLDSSLKFDRSNKLFGWDRDGKMVMDYTKYNLLTSENNEYNKGNGQIPTITTPFGKIAGVICFDADQPFYINQIRDKNVDILLVPVNEWPGIESKHTDQIAFRAKENRVMVINSAINGQNKITNKNGERIFSSFSDPKGISDTVVNVVI